MEKLNKLFSYINFFNKFAYPKLINSDKNYYYFKINKGYLTEINKTYLNELNMEQLMDEALRIIDNY